MNEKQEKIIKDILQKQSKDMLNNISWYNNLPGEYAGKIRINRQNLLKHKKEIQNSTEAYPTKLAYILETKPQEYNDKYPGAVNYENMKMKSYSILYLNTKKEINPYGEDISYNIGLELILKEYVDNNPHLRDIIEIKR